MSEAVQGVEAGRETDARIAVEVFGMRWMTYEEPGGAWAPRALVPPHAWIGLDDAAPDLPISEEWGSWVRRYSTDRTAALEVVDRLVEAGLRVVMKVAQTGSRVDVTDTMGDGIIFANADGPPASALPLAICEAALHPRVLEVLKARGSNAGPREGNE